MHDSQQPTGSLPPAASSLDEPGLKAGDVVGRYKLLGRLGSGGFGVVFEAEQTEPVRRRVALKVIKPGMDSKAVVTRFEAERQALAVMDHPNIARVLDGGVTAAEQGLRPFFVMELVRGAPITEFCDTHRLTIEERCRLFVKVCNAVQHAHTKGVVHRDLKPSNVLVAYDAEGAAQPKVIDFGVAKALNQRLTEATIFTEQGQLLGTPEYMSPEQAEMSGLDIDTRSDVYSLGVVLYELLTGVLPFDSKSLRAAGFAEIQRIIREQDPIRPSQRLSTALSDPESGTKIIAARSTEARHLSLELRRDLDWVVMKCLEKSRERRYDACSALAADLHHFLEHEPLDAGPPDLGYRLSKILRRHRGPAIAAAACVTLLVLGIAGTSFGLVSAQRAAEDAKREATTARLAEIEQRRLAQAEAEARAEADKAVREAQLILESAQSVNSMFGQLLIQATPAGGSEADTEIFRRLAGQASDYLKEAELVPEVASPLRLIVCGVLLRMGEVDEARPHIALLREQLDSEGASPRTRLWYETRLADHWFYSGQGAEYADVFARLFVEVASNLPLSDPLRATAFTYFARLKLSQKRYAESIMAANEALRATPDVRADHPIVSYLAAVTAASARGRLGEVDWAIEELESLYSWHQEHLGPLHAEAGAALSSLRDMYIAKSNVRGLERTRQRHAANVETVFGFYSDYAIRNFEYYASAFDTLGASERAAELREEALSRTISRFGPRHPETISLLDRLARRSIDDGDPLRAIVWLEVFESADRWDLIESPEVLSRAIKTYTRACISADTPARARSVLNKAAEAVLGLPIAERPLAALEIGWALHDIGQYDDAIRVGVSGLDRASHRDRASLLRCIARSADRAGQHEEAARWYDQAILASASADVRTWERWATLSNAAWFFCSDFEDAPRGIDLLRQARDVWVHAGPDYANEVAEASLDLARMLRRSQILDAASVELDRALQASSDAEVVAGVALERAHLLAEAGDADLTLDSYRLARSLLAGLPDERYGIIDAIWGEANALKDLGQLEAAVETGLEASKRRVELEGADDSYHLHMLRRLSEWAELGQPGLAEELLERTVEICESAFGDQSIEYQDATSRLESLRQRTK